MACRKRVLTGEESTVQATISDALLFATMCIVGFPVDAYLKDSSVYSGIFFTASVGNNSAYLTLSQGDSESGIVLKNARMIKKGKCATNVRNGSVIETLVVRFADLLQVAAKGSTLPENGVACSIAGDPFKIIVDRDDASTKIEETQGPLGNVRQAGGDTSQRELVDCDTKSEMRKDETKHEVQSSITQIKSVEEACNDSPSNVKRLPNGDASCHAIPSSHKLTENCQKKSSSENSSRSNDINENGQEKSSSENSSRSNDVPSRVVTHHISAETGHPKHPNPTPNGSKLNPGAKLFCPSVTNRKSLTPPAVPTVANVAYVPENLTAGPISSSHPDVEINPFISRSSLPIKYIPQSNLVAGNGFIDSQPSQQFIGHMGARTQAVRYGGQQLHPNHAGPTYVASNPQNVMVGRGGQQLIYMHPVSHDVNQAATAFSQVSLRPSLTPHFGHLLKHQGNVATPALQLYVNPPFMSGAQQQVAMQNHNSFNPPPFPVIHPISVSGGATTGFFTPKFP